MLYSNVLWRGVKQTANAFSKIKDRSVQLCELRREKVFLSMCSAQVTARLTPNTWWRCLSKQEFVDRLKILHQNETLPQQISVLPVRSVCKLDILTSTVPTMQASKLDPTHAVLTLSVPELCQTPAVPTLSVSVPSETCVLPTLSVFKCGQTPVLPTLSVCEHGQTPAVQTLSMQRLGETYTLPTLSGLNLAKHLLY